MTFRSLSACNVTGGAALLEVEGAGWLLLAKNTPPGGRRVLSTRHALSCGLGGGAAAPPRKVRHQK